MQHITTNELEDKLSSLRACTAVAIQIETLPKLNKKNRETGNQCPWEEGDISKINAISGLLGSDYSNACNNQLGREEKNLDFTAQKRTWGTLSENRVLVYHTTKEGEERTYLQVSIKASTKPVYLWGERLINVDDLKPYMAVSKPPKTQDAIDKKIILRDINLAHVKRIKLNGELYIVGIDNLPIGVDEVREQMEERNFITEEDMAE